MKIQFLPICMHNINGVFLIKKAKLFFSNQGPFLKVHHDVELS